MMRFVLVSVLLTAAATFGNAASLGGDILKPSNLASTLAGVVRDCAPSSGGTDERVWECLTNKAVSSVEHVVRAVVLEWQERDLQLADNVVLTASNEVNTGRSALLDSANSLPELLNQFLSTRTLEIKFPKDLVPAVARNFEEARGKLKKAGGLVAALLMMKGALGAMALGALALIAGKALILAKLSLLLSILAALKKSGGGGGGSDHRRSGRRADHVAENDTSSGTHHQYKQTWDSDNDLSYGGASQPSSSSSGSSQSSHKLVYRGHAHNYN